MAVEIREIVLTARVTETPAAPEERAPVAAPRELVDACLAEVRRLLERRERR
jgi:hypothetical protein